MAIAPGSEVQAVRLSVGPAGGVGGVAVDWLELWEGAPVRVSIGSSDPVYFDRLGYSDGCLRVVCAETEAEFAALPRMVRKRSQVLVGSLADFDGGTDLAFGGGESMAVLGDGFSQWFADVGAPRGVAAPLTATGRFWFAPTSGGPVRVAGLYRDPVSGRVLGQVALADVNVPLIGATGGNPVLLSVSCKGFDSVRFWADSEEWSDSPEFRGVVEVA